MDDPRSSDDYRRPDPDRGVFETLLVRDGRVQALDRHLQRLGSSVVELYGESLPADLPQQVRVAATRLAGEHRLRVKALSAPSGLTVELECERLVLPDPSTTLALQRTLIPGGLGAHKWCDRRLLDRHSAGSSVPLIVDRGDEVLEAGWANVWIVEGRRIVTPPADGRLLPGVTRGLLLELSPELGLTAALEPVSLARAARADAIFLTSSLRHAVGAVLAERSTGGNGHNDPAWANRGDAIATTTSHGDSVVAIIRAALSNA